MTCTLAGTAVADGALEAIRNGDTIEVKVMGSAFSAAQLAACSASCFGSTDIACSDGATTYTGKCYRVCCVSCGSIANIQCCSTS